VLLGASFVLLVLACASPVKTAYEAAPDTDFSKYKTYAWLTDDLMSAEDPITAAYISPQDDARVRTAVAAVLDERGAKKAPAESADVIVAFSVTREKKTQERVDPGRSTVYYPGYSGRMGYHTNAVTVVNFIEGTLTIQFFDRETRQHIWSGWGSKRLSKKHETPEHLEQAVEQILSNYPPPQ
jgi:hypothetical protein